MGPTMCSTLVEPLEAAIRRERPLTKREWRIIEDITRREFIIGGTGHDLGRTGRVGLWNEVADGLGLAVAHTSGIPSRPDVLDALADAVRTPGTRPPEER